MVEPQAYCLDFLTLDNVVVKLIFDTTVSRMPDDSILGQLVEIRDIADVVAGLQVLDSKHLLELITVNIVRRGRELVWLNRSVKQCYLIESSVGRDNDVGLPVEFLGQDPLAVEWKIIQITIESVALNDLPNAVVNEIHLFLLGTKPKNFIHTNRLAVHCPL
jgi:hypothetical protein